MKTFDELLFAAFMAGRRLGYDMAREDSGSPMTHDRPPTFDQWRETITEPCV